MQRNHISESSIVSKNITINGKIIKVISKEKLRNILLYPKLKKYKRVLFRHKDNHSIWKYKGQEEKTVAPRILDVGYTSKNHNVKLNICRLKCIETKRWEDFASLSTA